MIDLSESLDGFLDALGHGDVISCDSQGKWGQEGVFMRLVRLIPPFENSRITNLIQIFQKCILDQLESVALEVNRRGKATKEWLNNNQVDTIISISELFLQKFNNKSAGVQTALRELEGRVIALKYRCGKIEPQGDISQGVFNELTAYAQEWKQTEIAYTTNKDKLSQNELSILKAVCSYSKYAEYLIRPENSKGRYQFFAWALRNQNDLGVIVQYPYFCDLIPLLSPRMGYFNGSVLPIDKTDTRALENAKNEQLDPNNVRLLRIRTIKEVGKGYEKQVQLLFKTKDGLSHWVNCLDPKQEVIFEYNASYKMEQILEIFKNKNLDEGPLEVSSAGITNWSNAELSPLNSEGKPIRTISLSDNTKEFFSKFPSPKYVTVDQAKILFAEAIKTFQEKYGNFVESGEYIIGGTMANRRFSIKLYGLGTHAYRLVAIPKWIDDQLYYQLHYLSKGTSTYPKNAWEQLVFLVRTYPNGRILADVSPFLTHREHKGKFFPATVKEMDEEMLNILKAVKLGWENKLPYQIQCHNCAQWVIKWEKVFKKERVPEDFLVSYWELEVPFLSRLPRLVHYYVLPLIYWILGGGNEYPSYEEEQVEQISIINSALPLKNKVHLPAVLFERED